MDTRTLKLLLTYLPFIHFISNPNRMSIQSDNMVFYYMARDNLCFLTLCEESYPKRMAFLYLEEVADLILQELVREHGNGVRTTNRWLVCRGSRLQTVRTKYLMLRSNICFCVWKP